MVQMGNCPYHGQFRLSEVNDWQCPKCQKEIISYGTLKRTGKLDKHSKRLIKRASRNR